MQLTGPNRRRRRAHFDFETDPLARGDLVAFIVAISCRVRGSRRRASKRANESGAEKRENERLLCSVGIEPLLLRSRIGVESITVKPSAVTSIDCFILATRMKWAHPSLERQCDACETCEDLGDFRNGSLVCDVAPPRAFLFLARNQSVSNDQFTSPDN